MEIFEANKIIMPLYIDSAKTFLQLSIGALALTVVFREKVLGETGPKGIGALAILCWVFYLLTVAASALYQYSAIKYLDSFSGHPGKPGFLEPLLGPPAHLYGAMLVFFFTGSLFLVASSAWQLVSKKQSREIR